MRSTPCTGSIAAVRIPTPELVQTKLLSGTAAYHAAAKSASTGQSAASAHANLETESIRAPAPLARIARLPLRQRAWRATIGLLALAGLWGILTGGAAESWIMGAPAILLGTVLIFLHPAAPRWRLSLFGAVRFAVWFAFQSVHGASDVARRALAWRLPLAPGCRAYRTALPEGAPRLLFANAITLLPGTLTAEIEGDALVIHMLDTGADLDGDLAALERRVAALFALPAPGAVPAQAAT